MGFSSQNVTLKPASNFLHNSLAVLVKHIAMSKNVLSKNKPTLFHRLNSWTELETITIIKAIGNINLGTF